MFCSAYKKHINIILGLLAMPRIDFWWSQACPNRLISKEYPEEHTITHFAGGAMLKYFTSTFSSSCSVPIWTPIFGTKMQQKQNNQSISNQLNQTNIVLSKTNFQCELSCSCCLHNYITGEIRADFRPGLNNFAVRGWTTSWVRTAKLFDPDRVWPWVSTCASTKKKIETRLRSIVWNARDLFLCRSKYK